MNIIELAKRVGFQDADWNYNKGLEKALKQFADLVEEAARADEREECAKLVKGIETYEKIEKECFKFAAKKIRERGTT